MNLYKLAMARAEAGRPVTAGIVGAGKFGTMFLTEARATKGLHVVAVADLDIAHARQQLKMACWPAAQFSAGSFDGAVAGGTTFLTDDAAAMIADPRIEVIVEATGNPATGIELCQLAIAHGKHVIMVNVEADALAGPLLARKATAAGVIYSLAWGDQPALICEQVDWARACGFNVVAAGKGTRYHPSYHASTPETLWEILDKYLVIKDRASINPKMFNSFIDGSKSGIEMTAVCNATGLAAQGDGLSFPAASRFELADVCKPQTAGGVLQRAGVTEVVSSVDRHEQDVPHHLSMGTFVVFEADKDNDYARRCFREYNMLQDKSGHYAALYRPIHMIGLELGISVLSVALRGEATGAPHCFNSDVVATAKRDLKAGEILDGEGGYCVWGRQMPAAASLSGGHLPLGLAHDLPLQRDIAAGEALRWSDVRLDEADATLQFRRDMEDEFAPSLSPSV